MKSLTFIVCALSLMSVHARQEQELFLQAGILYQEGKIQEAYNVYQSLPVKSAGTLYNLGNCAYRLSDYGRALGYWLQACTRAPRFMYPWLMTNIERVSTELGVDGVKNWHMSLIYFFSYIRLLFVQLLIIFFAFVGIVLWVTGRLRSWLGVVTIVVFVALLSVVGLTYVIWYRPSVVIIEKNCKMHTGPDNQFPARKEVMLGVRARVVGVQDSWYKISYLKERGWVHKSCIMAID